MKILHPLWNVIFCFTATPINPTFYRSIHTREKWCLSFVIFTCQHSLHRLHQVKKELLLYWCCRQQPEYDIDVPEYHQNSVTLFLPSTTVIVMRFRVKWPMTTILVINKNWSNIGPMVIPFVVRVVIDARWPHLYIMCLSCLGFPFIVIFHCVVIRWRYFRVIFFTHLMQQRNPIELKEWYPFMQQKASTNWAKNVFGKFGRCFEFPSSRFDN